MAPVESTELQEFSLSKLCPHDKGPQEPHFYRGVYMPERYRIVIVFFIIFMLGNLSAKNPHKHSAQQQSVSQTDRARTLITINNWEYWLRNDGQSAHTPDGNVGGIYPGGTASVIYQDGLIWGCRVNDNNPNLPPIRVGGQTYNVGTSAGYVVTPGPNATASQPTPIWRIRADWTRFFDGEDGSGEPILHLPEIIDEASARFQVAKNNVMDIQQLEIIEQYKEDWLNWPTHLGAPYYDVNGDGSYTPGYQEDLNNDGVIERGEREEPGIALADQVVWYVNHDLDPVVTNALYGSPPIGLEIQNAIWAYDQPNATLGQSLFKQYTIINNSGYVLDSMFIAQWADPDIGSFGDDLQGVDTTRELGYAYNSFSTDSDFDAFDLSPATAGYDYLQGPLVDGKPGEDRNHNGIDDVSDYGVFNLKRVGPGKINLPLSSFGYQQTTFGDPGPFGDYEGTEELYNLLNGFISTDFSIPPQPFLTGSGPNQGQPTKFPLSGDPFSETGDVDGVGDNLAPGDRRFLMSSGSFSMQPGDTQQVVIALVGGIILEEGGDNLIAILQLWQNDDVAQFMYDNLFEGIPAPPAEPVAVAIPMQNSVMLDFGANAEAVNETEKDRNLLGFQFEGYNIYQLPTASATLSQATKIATIDKNNSIGKIKAPRYISGLNEIVNTTIQSGTNSGIRRYFYVARDFINDAPLYAGLEYHFAVTAYNAKDANGDGRVDNDIPDPALESALNILTVIPQGDKPGERRVVAGSIAEVDVSGSNSDGAVSVRVIDPTTLTGHDYEVTFVKDRDSPITPLQKTWTLTDVTENRVIVEKQQQLSSLVGNDDAPFYEGFQIKVSGPPSGINTTRPGPFGDISDGNNGWDWSNGDRWLSGVNWGGVSFFNGMSNGADFLGSTLIDGEDFFDVELRFAGDTQANQPDRWSEGYVYHRSSNYAFAGIGSIPFTAWNSETGEQLIVCFVEDANDGSANLTWDMGWNGSSFAASGGREYILITKTPYGSGPNPADPLYSQDGIVEGGIPCIYAIWPASRGSRPYLHESFDMQIYASNVNTENDVFRFSTQAIEFDAEQARMDVKQINVFPNPFYGINTEATSAFNSYITFTHLPQEAIIRIFTIGGNQVVKLMKNDESQFLRWNMRNKVGLQVASGLYIAHIELPFINTEKVLKIFIIQGDEIPEVF